MIRPAPPGTFTPGTKVQVGHHRVVIERYLNEGGFAHVYVVKLTLKDGNEQIAVLKRVAVPDKDALTGMRIEVETMKKLKGHRHIVTYIDSHASAIKDGGFEVFLLMEFCAGGGLIDFMNTRLQIRLTEPEILKIFSDISQGVACMHYLRPPLLHRDLKVENVLIAGQAHYPTYKICDFGSTAAPRKAATSAAEGRKVEDDIQRHTTLQYRSPEMIDVYAKMPINEKSDIWALGVLLYKLCYYTTPFEGPGQGQTAILNAHISFPHLPAYSTRTKMLILAMLQSHPDKRLNIYQVIREVCFLRSRQVPIPDIYQSPYHPLSTESAHDHRPKLNSDGSSSDQASAKTELPVKVGIQRETSPTKIKESIIPDVIPMRRGRPPAPKDSVNNSVSPALPILSQAPSPAAVDSSDPFAALDEHPPTSSTHRETSGVSSRSPARPPHIPRSPLPGRSPVRSPVQQDELSAKFPSLDEFDMLYDQGAVFEPQEHTPAVEPSKLSHVAAPIQKPDFTDDFNTTTPASNEYSVNPRVPSATTSYSSKSLPRKLVRPSGLSKGTADKFFLPDIPPIVPHTSVGTTITPSNSPPKPTHLFPAKHSLPQLSAYQPSSISRANSTGRVHVHSRTVSQPAARIQSYSNRNSVMPSFPSRTEAFPASGTIVNPLPTKMIDLLELSDSDKSPTGKDGPDASSLPRLADARRNFEARSNPSSTPYASPSLGLSRMPSITRPVSSIASYRDLTPISGARARPEIRPKPESLPVTVDLLDLGLSPSVISNTSTITTGINANPDDQIETSDVSKVKQPYLPMAQANDWKRDWRSTGSTRETTRNSMIPVLPAEKPEEGSSGRESGMGGRYTLSRGNAELIQESIPSCPVPPVKKAPKVPPQSSPKKVPNTGGMSANVSGLDRVPSASGSNLPIGSKPILNTVAAGGVTGNPPSLSPSPITLVLSNTSPSTTNSARAPLPTTTASLFSASTSASTQVSASQPLTYHSSSTFNQPPSTNQPPVPTTFAPSVPPVVKKKTSFIQARMNRFLSEANKPVAPPRTAMGYGRWTSSNPNEEGEGQACDDGDGQGRDREVNEFEGEEENGDERRPAVGQKPVGLRTR